MSSITDTYNIVNRSKIIRRILQLKDEKKKLISEHMWTEEELYDQIIGELEDLIT